MNQKFVDWFLSENPERSMVSFRTPISPEIIEKAENILKLKFPAELKYVRRTKRGEEEGGTRSKEERVKGQERRKTGRERQGGEGEGEQI
jgi:hypothetical protein